MDRCDALLSDWRRSALALEAEVAKAVIGQARVIRLVNIAVFARGHVLLQALELRRKVHALKYGRRCS